MRAKITNTYTSEELFHLVGKHSPEDDARNYGTLGKVLNSLSISFPPHVRGAPMRTTINWDENLETEKLVVPEVTCYADIPFDALAIHTRKYGNFGVVLKKGPLIRCGVRI